MLHFWRFWRRPGHSFIPRRTSTVVRTKRNYRYVHIRRYGALIFASSISFCRSVVVVVVVAAQLGYTKQKQNGFCTVPFNGYRVYLEEEASIYVGDASFYNHLTAKLPPVVRDNTHTKFIFWSAAAILSCMCGALESVGFSKWHYLRSVAIYTNLIMWEILITVESADYIYTKSVILTFFF